MTIGNFGRTNKLKYGSSNIEPGLIVNNNQIEHANIVRANFGTFEYPQPMAERVLRFDLDSFDYLVSGEKYFEEKRDILIDFIEENPNKLVKAHAQLPARYHVTPKQVVNWVDLQKEAGLKLIEILDVNYKSTHLAGRTIDKCLGKLDSGEMPIMGINTRNPDIGDLLLRIKYAEEKGIGFVTFYGDVTLTEKHFAIGEKIKKSDIFAHHAGLNKVKKYEIQTKEGVKEVQLEQAHLFQMIGFNAVSFQTIKRKEKKTKARKGRYVPPPAYDPSLWEKLSSKHMIEKYGEAFPSEVFHPATHERNAKEVYGEIDRRILNSVLFTHEACEVHNEMVKTRRAKEKGREEYSKIISEKTNAVMLINSIYKEYTSHPRLDKF